MRAAAIPPRRGPLRRLAKRLIPVPLRRAFRRFGPKLRILARYRVVRRRPLASLRYLLNSGELDNFTYEIANEDELSRFIATSLGIPLGDAGQYVSELQDDAELRTTIETALRGRDDRNSTMPYGRRLGWYAIARATKPRTIVETGVHDGLGSTVLLRALERNAAEGRPGSLISFDPVPSAGWLIPSSLRVQHQLVEGPAPDLFTAVLRDRQVDMFIHDSDHRYEHETAEFESILDFAAPGAVLLSDNAHAGTALRDFCERHNLSFRFFREAPRQHWYPGAGIGLALVSGAAKPEREVPHPRLEA